MRLAMPAQAFLDRHGPHTCLIDGANVALFGQNWEDGATGARGGFSFAQIGAVLEQVRRERPQLKPLLVRAPHTLACYTIMWEPGLASAVNLHAGLIR